MQKCPNGWHSVRVWCVGLYMHVGSLGHVHQCVWQEADILRIMGRRGFMVPGYSWASVPLGGLPCSVHLQPAFPSRVSCARHIPSTGQNQAGEGCRASLQTRCGVILGSRGKANSTSCSLNAAEITEKNAWSLDFWRHLDNQNAENSERLFLVALFPLK